MTNTNSHAYPDRHANNYRRKRFVDSLSSGQIVLWVTCTALAYFAAFRI